MRAERSDYDDDGLSNPLAQPLVDTLRELVAVKAAYVECEEDRLLGRAWLRAAIDLLYTREQEILGLQRTIGRLRDEARTPRRFGVAA